MSTQKGNVSRTRPQKYQNEKKFKNNKYDTSQKTKFLNSMQITSVCLKCKAIIEWKIRFKKYKPLTVPSKCIKCQGKCVKQAYHHICKDCCEKLEVCAKCGTTLEDKSNEEAAAEDE